MGNAFTKKLPTQKSGTRASGVLVCWLTIAAPSRGMLHRRNSVENQSKSLLNNYKLPCFSTDILFLLKYICTSLKNLTWQKKSKNIYVLTEKINSEFIYSDTCGRK
jgi:hypothetical protein